jgi:uncharacterized protein YeaC (DUF1315 family)
MLNRLATVISGGCWIKGIILSNQNKYNKMQQCLRFY